MTIDCKTFLDLIQNYGDRVKKDAEWRIIERTITGADEEDGGADYDVILKHNPTGTFYSTSYTNWEVSGGDWQGRLEEVEPKEVVKTIYVKKFKDFRK